MFRSFMRNVMFLLLFVSSCCQAEDACLFPPCPPPTDDEIEAVDEMFVKVKYILGAAFDVQNKSPYENIPDFVQGTRKLKQDIHNLRKTAKLLNVQAGGFDMAAAITQVDLCVSLNQTAIQYCHQALGGLKDYFWTKHFGTNWSGYEGKEDLSGFPGRPTMN